MVAHLGGDRLPGLERDVRRVADHHVDVPARSSKASARSPRRRSTPVPARLRSAQPWARSSSSTACTRAAGTSSATPWRSPPTRCTRSTTTGPSGEPRPSRRRPPSRRAARSRVGARRPRGRRAARRGGSQAVPVRCWSGSRAARRATRASYSSTAAAATSSTSASRERVDAEDVGEQLCGVVLGAGDPGLAQPGGGAVGEPTSGRRSALTRSSASSRAARSASTQESMTGCERRRRAPGRGCRPCSRCGGRRCGSPGSCRCGSARSGRPCGPGCGAPSLASASASSWAAASSRARRMRIACSLFCSWLFSFWQLTTMPVGQVGDPDRRVGGVDALTAGTAAAEDVDAQVVARRSRRRPARPRASPGRRPRWCGRGPGDSVTGTRCTRWTPPSNFSSAYGASPGSAMPLAFTATVTDL